MYQTHNTIAHLRAYINMSRASRRLVRPFRSAVALGCTLALGFGLFMGVSQHAYAKTSPEGYELTPVTQESIQKIRDGLITYKDGTIDTLIFKKLNPDPNADPDGDGLKTNEEIFTYQQDGKTYLYYASHPMIEDTDGDGYPDKTDDDPLSWKVSPRDAVLLQKLAYRDDAYIQDKVLNDNIIFTAQDCYEGNACYKLMHNEWSQYWKFTRSWHESDGTDVVLLEFSNKRYPFLKDKSVHLLGFRGTEGGGDVATDLGLTFGVFPAQAHSAVKIADQINQTRPKNTYVAGHSLGGFLSQVFLVRSVGNPYGPPENNDAHDNLNYWDTNKKDNPEIKQIFTFNAPALKKGGASTWLKEYSYMGDTLTRRLNSKHYVTGNDSITKLAGAMEGAIRLADSQGGHSSSSFFERKFESVEGFTVGKRTELSHVGYHNDLTDLCHFVKPTHLIIKEEGTQKILEDRIYACTEDHAKEVDTARIIPDHYEIVSKPDTLAYGAENVYVVRSQPYTLTYVFKHGNDVVHTDKVSASYNRDYVAPGVPEHPNKDFEYVLAPDQQIPKLAPSEITSDRTFEVELIEKPREVQTMVNLVDASGTVVKTVKYTTKPSETQPFDVKESDLPEGYVFADNDRKVTPGTNRNVKVVKKRYTLTYTYVDGQGNTLKEEREQVAHGDSSTYEPKAPEGYIISKSYTYTPASNVRADKTIELPIEPKPVEMHNVTLVFVTPTADGGKRQVATRTISVKHGDKVPQQGAPVHEKASEGYSWKIDNNAYQEVVSADKVIEVPVSEEVPAQPTPTQTYNVVVKYLYNNTLIKEETQQVKEGDVISVNVPTSSKGTYTAQTDGIDLHPHSHGTIEIPMTFEKKKVSVVREFVDASGEMIYTDTVMVPIDSKPPMPEAIVKNESVYRIDEGFSAPVVDKDTTVRVPMHDTKSTAEPEHVVSVAYYEGDKLLSVEENLLVKDGEYPPLNLPDVTDGRDGSYVLIEIPQPVTKSGDIRINLLFEPTRYPVHMTYVDKASGAELKDEFVEVVTGEKPEANLTDIDGSYQVDPSFEMPTITSEQEVRIPLVKTQPNNPGEDDSEPTPNPTPEPDPTPEPNPSPTPMPEPDPTPTPEPAPKPVPNSGLTPAPAVVAEQPAAKPAAVPVAGDVISTSMIVLGVSGIGALLGAIWWRRQMHKE